MDAAFPEAVRWSHQPGPDPMPDLLAPGRLMAQCLDAMPDAIIVTNAAGDTVFFNRAALRFFGPRVTFAVSAADREEFYHPDDYLAGQEVRNEVLRQGGGASVMIRAIRFDYAQRWHQMDLTPLFGRNARVTGVLARMTDIHDQRVQPAGLSASRS